MSIGKRDRLYLVKSIEGGDSSLKMVQRSRKGDRREREARQMRGGGRPLSED